MIKNNLVMLLVQILAFFVCLFLGILLFGPDPQTDTYISWVNLFLYIFIFLWIGYRFLVDQGSWLKNVVSVMFVCAVCFLLIIYLGWHHDKIGRTLVNVTAFFLTIPVKWAWDFMRIPVWIRSIFIFIPALSAFIGLQFREYIKNILN